jgi:hypothetical protein
MSYEDGVNQKIIDYRFAEQMNYFLGERQLIALWILSPAKQAD